MSGIIWWAPQLKQLLGLHPHHHETFMMKLLPVWLMNDRTILSCKTRDDVSPNRHQVAALLLRYQLVLTRNLLRPPSFHRVCQIPYGTQPIPAEANCSILSCKLLGCQTSNSSLAGAHGCHRAIAWRNHSLGGSGSIHLAEVDLSILAQTSVHLKDKGRWFQ